MGTAGIQIQELRSGMVETLHNGPSRCTDLRTRLRDGGNTL
ncbi:unnamed protein product [Staurois parvus]|uniref:Uncharacterized protein n=1 Tax=Staurois parvus TaxID=386267 RepID=A0ABN9C0K6_9NEOB|nr:unnamed protein product [Staurois parvus]